VARAALIRKVTGRLALVVVGLLLIAAVAMLGAGAQLSSSFDRWFTPLLAVNAVAIVLLLLLIAVHLYRLVAQFRARVLGSRLTVRLLGMFVLLVVAPVAIVYYLSVQFITRGIDSWFDVRIEQALDDALLLGRTSLEALRSDKIRQVKELAQELADVHTSVALIEYLDHLRDQYGFTEMTLFASNGRVLAFSSADPGQLLPQRPSEGILAELRQTPVYANFEPTRGAGLQLRVVVPVVSRELGRAPRVLQVLEALPSRHARLGQSVQAAIAEYEKLVFLRGPLKTSFLLTLTLVMLMAILTAVWVAIYLSRRLAAPLRDLAEGTRAVAAGDYAKQLPVSSSDELGVLVQSFNEMTRQIHQAQSAARRAQREAEGQRAYLETVLVHLSSGVLSFDARHRLLTHNTTADEILGLVLDECHGREIEDLAPVEPRLEPFWSGLAEAMSAGAAEWQREVPLFGHRGRQVLMCRGTRLPAGARRGGGYVVVFDDVTGMIQAQRDAAWAEVARRLAHEIKNPLTPIQLSAERIRHKYLAKLEGAERETLDRATRTIAEQVDSMKSMVNAFASYAQPKQMQTEPLNLNQMVQDVAELYRDGPVQIELQLDEHEPTVMADRGRVRQVLNNLVINARDALRGREEPRVRLATRLGSDRNGRFVDVAVEDNGPGFPPHLMDRLFEPYVTTKERGNGLGLAIVKRIADEHGATLWAENPDGGGARVTMRLPLEAAQVPEPPRQAAGHD